MIVERSPGPPAATAASEPLAAYSDLQGGAPASDIDWHADECDRIAEQALGDCLLA